MKLTTVFLIAACLQVSANSYSQKVTLKENNVTLKKVFEEIRKQTGYQFFYADEVLQNAKNVNINIKNGSIEEVLDYALKDEALTYTITDNTIIIKRKIIIVASNAPPVPIPEVLYAEIKGTVTDEKGQPLEGASILVKGTKTGTNTDVSGNFSITAEPTATLVVSYIGYETTEIKISNKLNITIQLKPVVSSGEQIVVVGYGTSKKANLTTSVSSINSSTIEKLSITRIEQALQGNAAGVLVLNQNGQPGDKPMIRIRGTGTNNSPDPLFLVDGFPVGSIEYLNPNDIERVDVLKDAASAAIYGARGANGVVLITTKTGKRSGGVSLTYDGYYGSQTAWKKTKVLNATDYATLMNESYYNLNPTGTAPPYANPSSLGVGTNWQDLLFEPRVPVTSHQVTASGGNEKTTYLTSFSYFKQKGVIGGNNSEFKRYSFRLNLDQKINNYLRMGTNMAYVSSDKNAIGDNFDQGGSVLGHAINIDPITPLYETDPAKLALYNVNAVKNGSNVYGISPLATYPNPLAQLATLYGNNKIDKVFGNVYGEVNILKGLKFKSSYGIDLSYATSNQLIPIYFLLSGSGQAFSTVRKNMSRSLTWQTENVLSYNHTFLGKHNVEALAGQSAFKFFSENLGGQRNDLSPIDPNLAFIDIATDIASSQINGTADTRTLSSYFGRVAYNYSGKYFASAVLRRDGSSRFGRNNPYATFPSASAAWLISKESFFPTGKNPVSLLKLRASWGQNGNENLGSSFPWASTISFGGQQYTFLNNGGVEYFQSGASLGRISNPFLKWETSEQTDIGIDAELWRGKLAVTADYYIKKTKDLLIAPDVPIIVGFPAPFVNGGSVENKGVELGINYKDKITKDLDLSVSFNISTNKNKVTQINNSSKVIGGAAYISMGSITRMTVGEPIGYFWGAVTGGIFQTQADVDAYTWTHPTTGVVNKIQPNAKPGDLKFLDKNNDGKIDNNDRINIGDPNPKYVTGFTIALDYKNFDFSIFSIGMFGHKVFNGNYRFDKAISNLPEKYLNRWTPTNTNTTIPRFVAGSANFSTVSDYYLEKGDFVRVKNIQVGYTVSQNMIKKAKINGMRFYVAIDNAFTFTKYSGFEPELGATSPLSLGIDRGVYPQSRTFRFGASLKL